MRLRKFEVCLQSIIIMKKGYKMNEKQVDHGVWRVPNGVPCFQDSELMGTLTIESDGSSKLEVYIIQSRTLCFNSYENYDVIWGDTADGIKVTLFGATSIWNVNKPEMFSLAYKVNKVFLGAHLKTGD